MKRQISLIEMGTMILGIFILAGCSLAAGGDSLEGTSWTLTSLAGSPSMESTTITVQFSNGEISGSSGCNSFGGTYDVKGNKLGTAELASTLMACTDSGVMDQEQAFMAYLQDAQSFEVGEGQLKIITADGVELLFVAAE
ncbi:MAG: META domain-containing protein [Chloroflexi bacterium]|nr:META domain-containing protein [Chloroflexota bacterium]